MVHEWQVQLDQSHRVDPRQRRFSQYARTRQTFPFDGGTLIGSDSGEFGGDVRWAGPGGDTVTLLSKNLVQFLRTPTRVYALTGLGHISLVEGDLWQIVPDTVGPYAEHVLSIGDFPQVASLVDSNTVLIVTVRRLVTVLLDSIHSTSWEFDAWLASYANSVVRRPDGRVYIGLRQGVARLHPSSTGYRVDWLVPKTLADSVSRGCPLPMIDGSGLTSG